MLLKHLLKGQAKPAQTPSPRLLRPLDGSNARAPRGQKPRPQATHPPRKNAAQAQTLGTSRLANQFPSALAK